MRHGQSLIELVAGMAVGIIFVIGAGVVIAPSLRIDQETEQVQIKSEVAGGFIGNISAWAAGNWNNVLSLATGTLHAYYLNTVTSPFTSSAGSQSTVISSTTYVSSFYMTDVYRDASGNATTTTAGNTYDPSTKSFTVIVSATTSPSSPALSTSFYLTRNTFNNVSQASWAGGSGQNNPVTVAGTSFSSDSNITVSATGSLSLATTSIPGKLDSATFDTGLASGVQLNSIIWQGSTPSNSAVGFQIAVSNSSSGPWNFKGTDGTIATYFTGNANTSLTIFATNGGYLLFEGYRYFRYRVSLAPDSSFLFTPTVTQVAVGWSP